MVFKQQIVMAEFQEKTEPVTSKGRNFAKSAKLFISEW